jgi:hypothetical protein
MINKQKAFRLLLYLSIFSFSVLTISCYYDHEEDLYKYTNVLCDTTNVTYSQSISKILSSNCNTCHSQSTLSGGVATDNYAAVKTISLNNKLWGTVSQTNGFSPMPKNSSKLSDCDLAKIKKWIDAGSPNN